METMNDTIYPGQEFFRIVHEGERAGLYRVEVQATGKEEATLLGAPIIVTDDESGPSSGGWHAGGGGATCWGENPY